MFNNLVNGNIHSMFICALNESDVIEIVRTVNLKTKDQQTIPLIWQLLKK